MIKKVKDFLELEDGLLAGYAVPHRGSGERTHAEPDHEYRLPFQRDRDRIVHSRAFRRLEYKTQVFIASIGDNYRTRLTHTLEVATLARTVARSLGLNEILAETIGLAHDLGHAPFGHAGQDILAELMQSKGGFEHNKQSLRVVEYLENRYASFPGLNLCRETLRGIMKHGASYEKSSVEKRDRDVLGPSLEAQITDLCDAIAYNSHDVEDGLESGLLRPKDLTDVSIWNELHRHTLSRFPHADETLAMRETSRALLNAFVVDLMETIAKTITKYSIRTREDLTLAWQKGEKICGFSESRLLQFRELKAFLNQNLYSHPEVVELSNYGQDIISALFHFFEKHPEEMPISYRNRIADDGLHRAVCDYVAGMTDRYAEEIAIDRSLIQNFF